MILARPIIMLLGIGLSLTPLQLLAFRNDHLIPAQDYGADAPAWLIAYRDLWEKKLFITPGELARFVNVGGVEGKEYAVSVYRNPDSKAEDDYRMTVTIAPVFLWPWLQERESKRPSIDRMKTQRCDLRLAKSTALAVHRAWLRMLREVRVDPTKYVGVDNPTVIFSASDHGKVLRGELPPNTKGDARRLADMGEFLAAMCLKPSNDLKRDFREVEMMAAKIYRHPRSN